MKKILKWTGIVVGSLFVIGFLAFLYLIPPFTLLPPEEFITPTLSAGPSLDDIKDPVQKVLAQRGKYLVTSIDCNGCHTALGDQGPNWNEYLAGGVRMGFRQYGQVVSRNLTPDPETGLARRTDEQVKRVLRSGLLPEGRVALNRDMPWGILSNFTEEERHAVVVYLRHLKAVKHSIPDINKQVTLGDPEASEMFQGADYANHGAKH